MICFKFRQRDRFALRLPGGEYVVWEVGEVRTSHGLRTDAVAIDLDGLTPDLGGIGPVIETRLDVLPGVEVFVSEQPAAERLWALEAGDSLGFVLPSGESVALGLVAVCCAGPVNTGGITLHVRRLLPRCGGLLQLAIDCLPDVDVARARSAVEDVVAGRPSPRKARNADATG